MRSLKALVAAALLCSGASAARAQTMTGALTCTGAFGANIGLALPGNPPVSVAATYVNNVFGNAECLCRTDDIMFQLQITMPVPMAMQSGTLEFWVGNGCESSTTRQMSGQTQCEQFFPSGINYQQFVQGAISLSSYLNIPIPAAKLFEPRVASPTCMISSVSNSVYIILTPQGVDPSMATVCKLALTEDNQGPSAPINVAAASGDGAITVSWSPPSAGLLIPASYQLLCADNAGQPIPGKRSANQAYSICVNGLIERRTTIPTSSSAVSTTDDGGVAIIPDGGTGFSEPLSDHLGTEAVDGGTDDGGATTVTNSDFVKSLDPRFTCSDEIKSSGLGYSSRVTGLQNGVAYQFAVIGIDLNGNAVASPVTVGIPQPAEDLYRRFRDQGGRATGFCFVATAAFGSYEDRYVHVLRDFRDEVLLPTSAGQAFVDWYYAHSPPAAQWISEHRAARILTQMALWPVIGVAAAILYLTAWQKALCLTLLLAFAFRRRIREKLREQRPRGA